MGQEKGSTVTNTTTQATPTPAELEMQNVQLQQFKDIAPQQTDYYKSAYNLSNLLLGGQELPGSFKSIFGGLDENAIGTQAANYAQKSMPGMQSLGILDSGESLRSISKGIANEVMFPAKEYNSNLLLNLLNLATGQASQGTSQFQGGTNTLAQSLAGLRSINQQGTTTTYSMNPFLKSFQQSAGTSLGNGSFGSAWKPTPGTG
jgi:hypothetical protein